jgi:hypothetical protein
MTTTETVLAADWRRWHDEREATLREPHGWLSLTGLHWLGTDLAGYPDLPGRWRATGDGGVEIAAVTADGIEVDGTPVDGALRVEPIDGLPGVLADIGRRKVEMIRRTDSYALRVRDPEAVTRTAFAGAQAYPVDARWVVPARLTAYPEPQRITVGAVVDGLNHFPTAVGEVTFDLAGQPQRLVALAGKDGGLSLHFRDATSGDGTYGGGRILRVDRPVTDGALTVDLNRTVNLPCAFTAHATCPLPPDGNTLAVAVEAGERTPTRPDLDPSR